jgi:thiol-disulfide isomerase/thioredoxin
MARKSKKSTARKSKKSTASTLDVRTPKDIPMFEKLLSKGPMAMVLVYADWCGYCTQFKDKVWNDSTLSKTKNVNTAAVHYDMLENTSLKNTPVKGYPSMFLVGTDKEAKEVPTPQTSQDLLKFDNTSANALNNTTNGNTNNENNTTNRNNNNMNNNMNNIMKNNNNVNNNNNNMIDGNENQEVEASPSNNSPLNNNSYSPMPPDALEDVVNKPETNELKQLGGSLFDILSRFNEGAQAGGRSRRRKTAKRKNRRAHTRKRQ